MNWLKLIEILAPLLIDVIKQATSKPVKGFAAMDQEDKAVRTATTKLRKALALLEDQ